MVSLRRFLAGPPELNPIQRRNFRNVELDAIAVGLANAAAPFLPVFLTRLGASSFQVGLLSSCRPYRAGAGFTHGAVPSAPT